MAVKNRGLDLNKNAKTIKKNAVDLGKHTAAQPDLHGKNPD